MDIIDPKITKIYKDFQKNDLFHFLQNYREIVEENEFFRYFDRLVNEYIQKIQSRSKKNFPKFKVHNDEHLKEHAFAVNVQSEESDIYNIVQINLLLRQVKAIQKKIQKFKENDNIYKSHRMYGLLQFLKEIYTDSESFFPILEASKGIKPESSIKRSNFITSGEIYGLADNIRYGSFKITNQRVSIATSIFLIRQALEVKLFCALGIDNIQNTDGSIVKLTPDRLVDFYFNHSENIIMPKTITKSVIKKIHSWTHNYIHTGILINHWLIDFALELLSPLMGLKVDEEAERFHINGGISIKKQYYDNQLYDDLMIYLTEKVGLKDFVINKMAPANIEAMLI
ncbi:hypothetical protein [Desulfobotulus mexicanus]|uniref:Uncharacterized protein n=1 Tax=Desulfobotulus mexicanus TaxID=2586642 RepID=A0A5Q4VHC5_9BACT|nr:hypothetical protein [Desulfobotulus mexicanus]TYT75682.1 hypothetical protein FIM25_04385 [Desulfobotulus mexicanus]